MIKIIQKLVIVIVISILLLSCNESYRTGYVNLSKIYQETPAFKDIDSVYNAQLGSLKSYIGMKEASLKKKKLSNKELEKTIRAYNDTVTAYKNKFEKEFNDKVNVEKIKIQKVIDSLSKHNKYDYVFSTLNNNILYVKDTTNNMTASVLKALK